MSDTGNNKGSFDINDYVEKTKAWAQEKPYHAIAVAAVVIFVLWAIF